jgi:hypothetical protein
MTAKTEAATIRAQLRVRYNVAINTYEVWSTLLGGDGTFRWIKVTPVTANQFMHNHNLELEMVSNTPTELP